MGDIAFYYNLIVTQASELFPKSVVAELIQTQIIILFGFLLILTLYVHPLKWLTNNNDNN
jgi:hypothetical protein